MNTPSEGHRFNHLVLLLFNIGNIIKLMANYFFPKTKYKRKKKSFANRAEREKGTTQAKDTQTRLPLIPLPAPFISETKDLWLKK